MTKKGWWNDEAETKLRTNLRIQVLESLKKAEEQKKPAISELFTDVYDKLPISLQEQKKELEEHLRKHPDHYPTHHHFEQ
jgi:2-oxoisovalerate dehydrogenase E1 component alpha subunit